MEMRERRGHHGHGRHEGEEEHRGHRGHGDRDGERNHEEREDRRGHGDRDGERNHEEREGRRGHGDRDGERNHEGHEGHRGHGDRDGERNHEEREGRRGHGDRDGERNHEEREGRRGRGDRDGERNHEEREGRRGHGDRDGGRNREGHEGRGSHGGRPERKGYRALVEKPGTHLLFIGSRSCTRHKGTVKLELQREGKLTFLSLEEIDWITGGYLGLIEEAAREIAEEVHPEHLVLFGGCQIELLSTDYQTLTQNLSQELGIEVRFHKGCHLVGYDPDATE